MGNIYVYHSLRRSGNHAIANWLIGNILKSDEFQLKDGGIVNLGSLFYYNNSNLSMFRKAQTNKDVFIGIEGEPLKKEDIELSAITKDCKIYWLFGLRSFHNHYASAHVHKKVRSELSAENFVGNWLRQSGYLDFKTYVADLKFIPVLFDKWFTDKDYRDSIAAECDLENNDIGINKVSWNGGGSTFDQRKYDGKAQEMLVLDRWKTVDWSLPEHMNIIKQLAETNEKLFGPLPKKLKAITNIDKAIDSIEGTIGVLSKAMTSIPNPTARAELVNKINHLKTLQDYFSDND